MTSSNGSIFRLLALCEGNPPVTGGFPLQRPVTRSFDAYFHLPLNNEIFDAIVFIMTSLSWETFLPQSTLKCFFYMTIELGLVAFMKDKWPVMWEAFPCQTSSWRIGMKGAALISEGTDIYSSCPCAYQIAQLYDKTLYNSVDIQVHHQCTLYQYGLTLTLA